MVERQLRGRGIRDPRVLDAFERIPRHVFVPEREQEIAYADSPLPIGSGQTISQPLMVAEMLQEMELRGDERVLDVGAGSGYQTALLTCLAREVVAIERLPEL
ncbi:MAG: protein-L-isoaspartate O-methyltransferase, partial [Sandaracinaceae bacterium]|nr:protein-L-isoaspartate O-methyltransferase [Sandaracinaceae bacterium]